jgi:hypothetical protein
VIFESREQFERLQAVNPELLVKIVLRPKVCAREFEMGGGEIQDLVSCLD